MQGQGIKLGGVARTIRWPVVLKLPRYTQKPDGNVEAGDVESIIEMDFLAISGKKRKKIAEDVESLFDGKSPHYLEKVAGYVVRVADGWVGVYDNNGNPADFSEATINELLDSEYGEAFVRGLYTALAEIESGMAAKKTYQTSG